MTGPPLPPLILIVDDSADVRRTSAAILKHAGYPTAEARDGEEGVQKAIELLPALVLLDLGMPKVDGLEATKRLKADERTRAIPIIIVSAFEEAEHTRLAVRAGAHAFLQKPVRLKSLVDAVRKALNGEQPQR